MFGPMENNPRGLPENHFTAHIGLYPTFNAFLLFYEHSIQRLFSDLSEGNGTPDLVAIPLLFLMRHAIELGYKFSLQALCEMNSSRFAPEENERHSLIKLHRRLGSEFKIAAKEGRVSQEDR